MSVNPTPARPSTATPGGPRTVSPPVPAARKQRRRTLGSCAHCGEPVDMRDEYVRLYRRAWHLDCALASGEPVTPGQA